MMLTQFLHKTRALSVLFGSRKKLNSQISYFYAKTTRSFNNTHASPQTLPLCPSLHITNLPIPPQSPLPQPNLIDLPLLHLDWIRRLCCGCMKVADLGI